MPHPSVLCRRLTSEPVLSCYDTREALGPRSVACVVWGSGRLVCAVCWRDGDSRLEPLVLSQAERRTLENWAKRRKIAQGWQLAGPHGGPVPLQNSSHAVWPAGSRSRSGGSVVLVDHTVDCFAALDRCVKRHDYRRGMVGRSLLAGLVWAVPVVATGVLAEGPIEGVVRCRSASDRCTRFVRCAPTARRNNLPAASAAGS
jgi:hypothetical protein